MVKLFEKPEDTRTLQDLVEAGLLCRKQLEDARLLSPEHLKKYSFRSADRFTIQQRRHLTSDGVILALARGIRPDFKAFRSLQVIKKPADLAVEIFGDICRYGVNNIEWKNAKGWRANVWKSNLFADVSDAFGMTPLNWVAMLRSQESHTFEDIPEFDEFDAITETVKIFLDNGATVDWQDPKGRTALHLAADRGNFKTVKVLLAAGADPYLTSDNGWTALHYAAAEDDLETVKALVAAGPNAVNQLSNKGLTPLYYATRSENTKMVSLLIEAGALHSAAHQPNDTFQDTPREPAKKTGNTELVALLTAKEETAAPQERREPHRAKKGGPSFKWLLKKAKKIFHLKK